MRITCHLYCGLVFNTPNRLMSSMARELGGLGAGEHSCQQVGRATSCIEPE